MKKILIVEDDQKIGLAMSVRLKANGYEVFVAGDAETGLQMAIEHRPDLVIMDISLPTRSGLNLAAQFRSLPMTVGIPIMFMTASSIPGFQARAKELGAVAFIKKPFEDGEVLAAVRHALGEDKNAER